MWGTHFSWWVGTIGRADEKLEDMSDRPKIEVIDRRKIKAEEEKESGAAAQAAPAEKPAAPAQSGPGPGPRLVVNEATREASGHEAEERESAQAAEKRLAEELPLGPTAEEGRKSKAAYDASAQRIEDLIRAQNPAVGAQPPVGFEHLVQQFYLSAMLQMGAGTQEGQRPFRSFGGKVQGQPERRRGSHAAVGTVRAAHGLSGTEQHGDGAQCAAGAERQGLGTRD
jgi:hypothetical protein